MKYNLQHLLSERLLTFEYLSNQTNIEIDRLKQIADNKVEMKLDEAEIISHVINCDIEDLLEQ